MASSTKGKGRGHGRRNEDPDVQLSKTLSWILRHGAKKEGLEMRSDGYVRLDQLLSRPKLHGVKFDAIRNIVETNNKQRFTLILQPIDPDSTKSVTGTAPIPVELPHPAVTIPPLPGTEAPADLENLIEAGGIWYIRANQGHTLKVEDLELHEVKDPNEIPIAIHGTTLKAWHAISRKGLSVMGRNHIHIAAGKPGASGVLSGMRTGSQVLIYIDVAKAMADGIKFLISANGVILTEGNEEKFLLKEYFEKVEAQDGTSLL
ncbi:hypothetical protein M408DRAFT_60312 [Serendipita vermifera MAFF 305830]|uniref:2'-phosphotransferase n=1 Tax=Serendipita vermifera MAFF 305830 TaxID=933852 RepID=A0A0C2X4T3_SERVB|nr:hypothetical protein M408DRAFT_14616 [Serendipita vermifera MAFF 305830]KIM33702.1 hypothetical protein M408DRAFT_60312 [Serendipita vermifera MAFF 305830]